MSRQLVHPINTGSVSLAGVAAVCLAVGVHNAAAFRGGGFGGFRGRLGLLPWERIWRFWPLARVPWRRGSLR
jgi:hypothetical protein